MYVILIACQHLSILLHHEPKYDQNSWKQVICNRNVLRKKEATTRQTKNICLTFVQRRHNVFDVGQILYKCYTKVLCLLGTAVQRRKAVTSGLLPGLGKMPGTVRIQKFFILLVLKNTYIWKDRRGLMLAKGLLNCLLFKQAVSYCLSDLHGRLDQRAPLLLPSDNIFRTVNYNHWKWFSSI